MSPEGVMSSEKACNSPGLSPVKGQKPNLGTQKSPEISSLACLCVSPRPRHRTQCWLSNQRLSLLRVSCLETPGSAQIQETPEQSRLLRARRRSHYLVLHYVHVPSTAPPHAG
jgi:hypothetical protein